MSTALARSWAVMQALAGHNLDGLRLAQVAGAVRQSASTTLRDLQALDAIGCAERVPGKDDRWRLSPRVVQLALAHLHEVNREDDRLADFRNRYSRTPV